MRVLVTGGTGVLGTLVVDRLVARGHDAVVFARHPPKKFAFHALAPLAETRTITASLQGVLMEVVRVLDEERRVP